jgi:aspartyl-tRNA(Asn)/glutamyl-tRNA(Gln) amidotransferase subunit A
MRALIAHHGSMIPIEAYREHRKIFDSADAERMDRRLVARAMLGRAVAENDVIALRRGRERLIPALAAELKGALLVLPAAPMTAPEIAPIEADDDLFRATTLRAVHYTVLGNLFRMCGLALPFGTDRAGLPTGLQFLATAGSDETLLSLGWGIEQVLTHG